MSPEPFSVGGAIGKVAGLLLKPTFSAVAREIGKRGAADVVRTNPASLGAELDAALSVLLNDAETAFGQVKVWLKLAISAPPDILTDEDARSWLARADVQDLLKQATIALITEQPLDEYVEDAKRLYGHSAGGSEWYGEPLFVHAVSFMALSITTEIDTGTKVLLEAQKVHAAQRSAESAALAEKIDLLLDQREAADFQGQLPVEAMDGYLEAEVQRRERLRSVSKPGKLDELLALAGQAYEGSLRAAGAKARGELFRFVAAELARSRDADGADRWLGRAMESGIADVAPDQARIAILRDEPDKAIELLDGSAGRLANSLRIDALRKSGGSSAAVAYFEDGGSIGDLTGHALPVVAQDYFELGRASDGERVLADATAEQIFENPLLLFQRARARLALMAGSEAKELFKQPTALPHPKSLRDDAEGRRLAAAAIDDLSKLAIILRELDESDFLEVMEPLDLFLQLLFEPSAAEARVTLRAKLADPDQAQVLFGLARLFDVPFDPTALRSRLARTRRLRALTDPELHTAFQLVVAEKDPVSLLAFIEENRDQLARVEPTVAAGIEIEALIRIGRIDDAKARLAASGDTLPDEDRQLLLDLAAGGGEASLASHLARFEANGDERDLVLLVQAMVEAKDSRSGEYAFRLWHMRHRTEDAIVAADSYASFGQDRELGELLDVLGSDADSNPRLQAHRAWLLFRRGELVAARKLVVVLQAERPDDDDLRQLEINIALELGDWQRLSDRIEADLDRLESRSVQQLLQSATLAQLANHPQTMRLLRAAVEKAPGDPQVLLAAWDLALRQGLEEDEEASRWLQQAIAVAGDGGVIRTANIEDVIALGKEQAEQAKELDKLIMSGQLTVGMAAKPLGTTITELMLGRVWQNSELADPRTRLFLPFYAGNRGAVELSGVDSIALDLASILMLHVTGLLEALFEAFPKVVLPSGTLSALFEHRRQAERGQPSRTRRAALIEQLIASKQITVLPADATGADEVDILWAAAEERDGLVVHAPPLHVPGSFAEEVRDPTPFTSRLVSPRAIGEALQGNPAGEDGAPGPAWLRFSTFQERWPSEPDALAARPLMVDGTALFGFADAELLEELIASGARLFVTSDVREICAGERQEHEARKRLLSRIEAVRAILSNALLQGRAQVGPALARKRGTKPDFSSDPLVALLNDPGDVEVLVSDERAMNKYPHATDAANVSRPVATSLDVMDALVARRTIANYVREQAHAQQRASGVGLLPLRDGEFAAAARRSNWSEGPGPQLKAIRDSILLPFLRGGVQLPEERPWASQLLYSLAQAARDAFRTLDTVEEAKKAADFALLCLPDIRAYVGPDATPEVNRWAIEAMVLFHGLAANAADLPNDRRGPYNDWYQANLYPLLAGRDRDLLPAVEAKLEALVTDDHSERLNIEAGDYVPTREALALFMFSRIVRPIADRLIQHEAVRDALGVAAVAPLDIAGREVERADLFGYFRSVYAGDSAVLRDRDGTVVADTADQLEDGTLRVRIGQQHLRFEYSALLSNDRDLRSTAMRELLGSRTLAREEEQSWLDRAERAPLSDDEFFDVTRAADFTAEGFASDMLDDLPGAGFDIEDLVPRSEAYFAAVVPGPPDVSHAVMFRAFERRDKGRVARVDACIAAGPLAVSPQFNAGQLVKGLGRADQLRCCEGLIAAGDPFSLLAAFQIVCRNLKSPKLRAVGDRLIELAWGQPGALDRRATDFHVGAIVTSAATLKRGDLRDWPLHRRRLAIFAHAGHIARALGQFEVESDELLKRTLEGFGSYHQLSGALDQLSARVWEPGLLSAKTVQAYLLRRFSQVLIEVPAEARPEAWVAALEKRIAEFESSADALAMSWPGPLDEFIDNAPARPLLAGEEFASFLVTLEGAEPVGATNLAYCYPLAFDLEPGVDTTVLEGLLETKLGLLEGEDRDQALQIMLLLAWRWRLPQFAGRIFRRFGADRESPAIVLDWAIMAASASEAAADQAALLEELGTGLAMRTKVEAAPGPLARALRAVASADPAVAPALAKARLAASLAV